MAGPLWRAAAFIQRHRTSLLVGSCAGLFGVQISFHLFPDPIVQWLYQYWPQGQPAPLSPHLWSLFQEVLKDIGVPSGHCYKPFTAFTFQPVSAGFPRLPAGAVVGIPAIFLGGPFTVSLNFYLSTQRVSISKSHSGLKAMERFLRQTQVNSWCCVQ